MAVVLKVAQEMCPCYEGLGQIIRWDLVPAWTFLSPGITMRVTQRRMCSLASCWIPMPGHHRRLLWRHSQWHLSSLLPSTACLSNSWYYTSVCNLNKKILPFYKYMGRQDGEVEGCEASCIGLRAIGRWHTSLVLPQNMFPEELWHVAATKGREHVHRACPMIRVGD